jgi:2-oxoglutarate dehydrogenase E1 component
MTPKGLLRLREAASELDALTAGSFEPVLGDPDAGPSEVRRLVLCSGKVYYDIVGHELRSAAATVAVARIEQLYPFPLDAVASLVTAYPEVREIVWAQEEPQNMGPWRSIRHRLEEVALHAADSSPVHYVGRPWRASTSEGYPTLHHREQDRIVRLALGFPTS